MLIFDCNYDVTPSILDQTFDFCIVGAGISGVILADQLSDQFNVALIESGDLSIGDRVQELNEILISGHSVRENFQSRVRQFGGACNLWAGRSLIFDDIDLSKRKWIVNSGWPLSLGELKKYYSKLHDEYGMADFSIFQKQENDLTDALYADISKDTDLELGKAVWGKNVARFNKNSASFKKLKKNRNVTLFSNATVEKLSELGNKVASCAVVSTSKNFLSLKAQYFVLATGGIENARILLSSRDKCDDGIGNAHDNVGRYFMDHPSAVRSNIKLSRNIYSSSLFVKPVKNGRFKNIIRFNDSYQKDHLLTNNHLELSVQHPKNYEEAFSSMVQIAKTILKKGSSSRRLDFSNVKMSKIPEIIYLLSPSEVFPHFVTEIYYKFNKILRRPINAESIVISHHLEQVPNRDSRITLCNEVNFLGINKVNMHWLVGNREIETANKLEQHVIDMLKKSGWVDPMVDHQEVQALSDASHHMGTTRMSEIPQDGVVDPNCKVHTIDNLYIAGSSVFPTSGSANPTYTIAALTLRLASHLRNTHAKNV